LAGKTQLAVEFAYRYGRWFKGGVFWVSCADPVSIPEAIAACGPVLCPADAGFSGRPLPDRVALVASTWASDLPRLLIFDNCEDEAILDAWAPKGGGCRLLITARRVSWSPARGITAVPLGRLTRPESLALLCRYRPDLGRDDPVLDAIADELGDLPLALELADSYLARYAGEPLGAPATYLAELRAPDLLAHVSLAVEEDTETPAHARSLIGHERNVARTFEVSLRRLRPGNVVDWLARELFARAALLAPGVPIPRRLLNLCVGFPANDANASRGFADAVNRLLDLALMERASAEGAVVLHRLLAAFARSRMEQADATRKAVEAAIADETSCSNSRNDPTTIRSWAPHLMAVARAAWRDGRDAGVRLLYAAGYYRMLEADLEASHDLLQLAVERAEASFGSDHPELASTLGNLGIVQLERGELAEADASQRRALAITIKAFGLDHPQVAVARTNLGSVQRHCGELAKAEASQRRALAIKERAYGPDHAEVAIALTNLGNVQFERRLWDKAGASLTRALAIAEKEYGPDHPQVAIILANLGIVQFERGERDKGEASLSRALALTEKMHGPDHPQVASILIDLGSVQRARGRINEARESYTRAATILTAKLGEHHPRTKLARRLVGEISGKTHISGGRTRMMDPIVAAVLSGVAASAGKVASKAVEDAYAALKGLLVRKVGEKSEAAEALAKLEAKPDSEGRKATVAEELKDANVADDPDLLDAARRLQAALDQLPAEGRAHVQHAVGSYIAQASGGSTATVNVGRKDSPSKG
jgi:tetratricopeptide (TPR) repeat protein